MRNHLAFPSGVTLPQELNNEWTTIAHQTASVALPWEDKDTTSPERAKYSILENAVKNA